MQIHDELVFDCPAQSECVTALRDIIKTAMETGISQHVQLQVGQRAVETHIDPGSTVAAVVDCRELTAALTCMLWPCTWLLLCVHPSGAVRDQAGGGPDPGQPQARAEQRHGADHSYGKLRGHHT